MPRYDAFSGTPRYVTFFETEPIVDFFFALGLVVCIFAVYGLLAAGYEILFWIGGK